MEYVRLSITHCVVHARWHSIVDDGVRQLLLSRRCIGTDWAAAASAGPQNAEEFSPLDLRQVKVGGEIGRRIDNTIYRNLMVIDVDKDYLAYLDAKCDSDRYIGLGKLIDAAVKLAAYCGDEKVLARKKHIVEKTLAAQEPDGYLGFIAPPNRMKRPGTSTRWDTSSSG